MLSLSSENIEIKEKDSKNYISFPNLSKIKSGSNSTLLIKIENRIQELTSTAVDSGFLKGLIEGLTHILELANSIVDTFGTLPTLLGAISGVVLQKRGLGKRKFLRCRSWIKCRFYYIA